MTSSALKHATPKPRLRQDDLLLALKARNSPARGSNSRFKRELLPRGNATPMRRPERTQVAPLQIRGYHARSPCRAELRHRRTFANSSTVAPLYPEPLARFQCAFRLFRYPEVPCGTKRLRSRGRIVRGITYIQRGTTSRFQQIKCDCPASRNRHRL